VTTSGWRMRWMRPIGPHNSTNTTRSTSKKVSRRTGLRTLVLRKARRRSDDAGRYLLDARPKSRCGARTTRCCALHQPVAPSGAHAAGTKLQSSSARETATFALHGTVVARWSSCHGAPSRFGPARRFRVVRFGGLERRVWHRQEVGKHGFNWRSARNAGSCGAVSALAAMDSSGA
jgi:hypothetical protein